MTFSFLMISSIQLSFFVNNIPTFTLFYSFSMVCVFLCVRMCMPVPAPAASVFMHVEAGHQPQTLFPLLSTFVKRIYLSVMCICMWVCAYVQVPSEYIRSCWCLATGAVWHGCSELNLGPGRALHSLNHFSSHHPPSLPLSSSFFRVSQWLELADWSASPGSPVSTSPTLGYQHRSIV